MPKILQRFFSGLSVCLVILSALSFVLQTPTQVLAFIDVPQLKEFSYAEGSTQKRLIEGSEAELEQNLQNRGALVAGADGILKYIMAGTIVEVGGGSPQVAADGSIHHSVGVLPVMGQYIAYMYDAPPATTQKYVADLLKSAGVGIAQPAYAQGLGFASLDPILESWKTFRNVAFLFFVIIFLAIGFMIMFRRKIGGQTVVTAQQAIPSIIMALLTVTFSFAIAGLLIDTMYFIMFMMLSVFGKIDVNAGVAGSGTDLIGLNFIQLGYVLISNSATPASAAVGSFVESVTSSAGGAIADLLGVASNLLITFIIAIAVLISVFRLFFELLKTYIAIIVSIVLSPILLMFGAIPGKSPFEGWLKGLIGNLAAFPIVLMIVILFDELTGALTTATPLPGSSPDPTGGFLPPYLIGQGSSQSIAFLIGFGMIMIMPDLVKEGKKMFGASGGVFEQFGNALYDSVNKGWDGNAELIPGLAASKLSNYGINGATWNPFTLAKRATMGSKTSREALAKDPSARTFWGRGAAGYINAEYRPGERIKRRVGLQVRKARDRYQNWKDGDHHEDEVGDETGKLKMD